MASLIKVDEMQANNTALMKFNSGAFNPTVNLTVTGGSGVTSETAWDAEANPVVLLPNTSTILDVLPGIPTVNGMYITIIYPTFVIFTMSLVSFDPLIIVPDTSPGASIHRVYYSNAGLWYDA